MSEHHFRGWSEGLVVGALESVALDRRAGQGADLGSKVRDDFRGDVKRVVVQELIDPEQQIQQGAEPCEPGITEHQLDEFVRRVNTAVDAFVGESFRQNQRAIERRESFWCSSSMVSRRGSVWVIGVAGEDDAIRQV